jgi:hypothetical protein
MMTTTTYVSRVLGLLRRGGASSAVWGEVAEAVMLAAEDDLSSVHTIEKEIGLDRSIPLRRPEERPVAEYKRQVIELLQNGPATADMWREVGEAVLLAAEQDLSLVSKLEKAAGITKDRTADLAAWGWAECAEC